MISLNKWVRFSFNILASDDGVSTNKVDIKPIGCDI